MIPLDVPIWVALGAVDLHWSFDRWVGIVHDQLGRDPARGLFVFLNRRRDRAKVLFHDGGGWCQLYKRLDRGLFALPISLESRAVAVRVSLRELELMLLGQDLPTRRRRSRAVTEKELPTLH